MRTRTIAACLVLLVAAPPHEAAAQEAPAARRAQDAALPEILILGTYHMGNPGRDVHNLEADDVLSEMRQQQMAELLEVLRRFRPTKVAVEAAVGSQTIPKRYESYLAGEYALSRNEIDQIGLRIAREVGHTTVYPVDVDGEFPYYRVLNYAKANGREAEFQALQDAIGKRVEEFGAYLGTHTILESLQQMNSDASVARDVSEYYEFVAFGEPHEYAGPDLVARWFERNIRIYRNIRALATTPDDRILVIYGAGHLGWLRQMVQDDPGVRLSKLADLVPR